MMIVLRPLCSCNLHTSWEWANGNLGLTDMVIMEAPMHWHSYYARSELRCKYCTGRAGEWKINISCSSQPLLGLTVTRPSAHYAPAHSEAPCLQHCSALSLQCRARVAVAAPSAARPPSLSARPSQSASRPVRAHTSHDPGHVWNVNEEWNQIAASRIMWHICFHFFMTLWAHKTSVFSDD